MLPPLPEFHCCLLLLLLPPHQQLADQRLLTCLTLLLLQCQLLLLLLLLLLVPSIELEIHLCAYQRRTVNMTLVTRWAELLAVPVHLLHLAGEGVTTQRYPSLLTARCPAAVNNSNAHVKRCGLLAHRVCKFKLTPQHY